MIVLFSGLVASLLSLTITTLINFLFQRNNAQKSLDSTLMQLNHFMLDNPFLESDKALNSYLTQDSKHDKELKDKYNIFCIMKYNYLGDYCQFYKFNLEKIKKHIHIKEYLKDNEVWWSENRTINYEAYDKKFIHIIEEVINES